MGARLNKIQGLLVGLCFMAFFSPMCSAYVLEGPHIIQLMTEQLGQADSLFISQKVVFYSLQPQQPEALIQNDSLTVDKGETEDFERHQAVYNVTGETEVQAKTIELDESLRYVFSEAFRSDIVSDDNQRIFVFKDGQTLTVIDGVISGDGETRFDLYKDLLFYRSSEVISERLLSLGIDISVSSLGKFDGHIAFVLGAEFPNESLPQVWIDMVTFHPLRMIIPSGSSAYRTDFLEIRYSQWRKISKIWYPMRTEFIQDGITVRAIEVNDYQINPSFSKDIFDVARLKSEYRQPVKTPTRVGETDGLSEVQKTIEEFKKIFE